MQLKYWYINQSMRRNNWRERGKQFELSCNLLAMTSQYLYRHCMTLSTSPQSTRYIHLSIYQSIDLSMFISINLSISVCSSLSVIQSVYISILFYSYLSISLCSYLTSLSICMSRCVQICLLVSLSFYLYINLSFFVSIYLSKTVRIYYSVLDIHFWINTLEKGMNSLTLLYGLNSIIAVLQRWLWH